MPQQALADVYKCMRRYMLMPHRKKKIDYGLRTKAFPIYLQNMSCIKPSIPLKMKSGTEEK